MIRKQIYVAPRHQAMLERLARAGGVSEAEVIRQALERQAVSVSGSGPPDPEAWNDALRVMEGLRAARPLRRQPWKREDLYKALTRHGRRAR